MMVLIRTVLNATPLLYLIPVFSSRILREGLFESRLDCGQNPESTKTAQKANKAK